MAHTLKEIEAILKPYNDDLKRHIARLVEKSDADVKRYTDALSEDFQGQVKVIAEQYSDIKKALDEHSKTLASHTEMIGLLMTDVTTIKSNVEFLKGALKKKVDYDEFLALERRMSLLESKIK